MLTHRQQPHPEEPRGARRLEGWATTLVYPTLRDGPAGLLRVRWGAYRHSTKARTTHFAELSHMAIPVVSPLGTKPARSEVEGASVETMEMRHLDRRKFTGRCRIPET